MRVEEISVGNRKAYLLIGTSGLPVEPVAKYMKYLYNSERSSNTLQTYCTALKFYFTYLEQTGIDYQQVSFEKLSNFVVWLRNPYENNNVVIHKTAKAKRRESTVNNYLTVVASFYDYLYRNDLVDSDMVEKLMKKMFIGAGGNGYKGFLHHVNGGKPISKNILKLKETRKRVQVFTKEQVEEIYYSTTNIRDKFLVRLLFESGLRIGEVLSLFLEDLQFDAKQRKHKIQLTNRGELPNGGKLKTGERKLDISQGLMNLYDDYLYEVVDEYN
uniref:site-specific integrase n=2 Tax=Priestia TaxID=2800373 RepID=UPI0034D679F9